MEKKHIEIIVPCYNEEACVKLMYESIHRVAQKLENYFVSTLFIDDGSSDNTLKHIKEIEKICDQNEVRHISFARNFGKESAIYGGLLNATGDYVALLDADLQHPPELLIEMVKSLEEGYECCGARRVSHNGEPAIRGVLSRIFYRFISKMTSTRMEKGTTDYRLMTRKFLNAVLKLSEKNRFTKGIFAWVGFEVKWVEYENVERAAGETKWSFSGLIKYALNGFMSFATAPLRGAVYLGMIVMSAAFIYGIWIVMDAIVNPGIRNGYSSILAAVLLIGGIIILLLGVIGEYLARIYVEVKNRPIYIEKEVYLTDGRESEDEKS